MLAIILLSCWAASAQEHPKDKWADWQPFLGTWEGAGSGGPGQGNGSFTFASELQGAVLVRHNYAQYPATKDRPAYRHDDLMVIYPDASSKKTCADYWDNEEHVIHYFVELADGGRRLVMTSDPSQPGPRYRLTYVKTGDNDLKLTFEVAPPNAPEKFKTYIEATAKRTKQ
ncbi:MAG: hypothetical protein LAO06_17795 [Acidobacteriia bacterium]|nr:hypothetical protein [Terriglobia bacterium]